MDITINKRYILRNGKVGKVTVRQEFPVPCWRGEVHETKGTADKPNIKPISWGLDGKDYSGHKAWDIIEEVK